MYCSGFVRLTALAFALAFTAVCGAASADAGRRTRAEPQPRFDKAEDVLVFINSYREQKSPKHVPAAVAAMSRLGLLREPEEAGIYIGFVAGVLGDNPAGAEQLVAKMFPMPPEHQVVIIKAIAFSGLADWKSLLANFIERMPARKLLVEGYLYRGMPLLDGLMTESTGAFAVDVQWGRYFATGAAPPAKAIIAALAWTAERDSVEKLTIGSMAKWTLATNATRDKGLRDIMKAEINTQPKAVRKALSEIIVAAETFETGRIKKDALKAIEELRAKGPQSNRDTVWWGQAGQTALALGCIAAGALGHVEVGVPCVIGGALSSAALKYMVPQQ
ncbi:MAG: hypothetical protein AB7E80_01210 [Hyphomicrobiaceae bacterium]